MSRFYFFIFCILILALSCNITPTEPGIAVDMSTEVQTIEGFGFFGAENVWWSSPSNNQAWNDLILTDLGVTMWRNVIYPHYPEPASSVSPNQDNTWSGQKPIVQGLSARAKYHNIPLKIILTVWSPPAELKCEHEVSGTYNSPTGNINEDIDHPDGTKEGGALRPSKYGDYARWINKAIQMYKDKGVDVYAVSLQNEPYFKQFYNSCQYTPDMYTDMINVTVPIIKQTYPELLIFGAEHMLQAEASYFRDAGFTNAIMSDSSSRNLVDRMAVHGYSDGVAASSSSEAYNYWRTLRRDIGSKGLWMTETSGYTDEWSGEEEDALALAFSINAALAAGDVSAWVWWQGSDAAINKYSLMSGTTASGRGKKYYASKQFYRFIRPGSIRRPMEITGYSSVTGSAFTHSTLNNSVFVFINSGAKAVTFPVANAPSGSYSVFRTSETENCVEAGTMTMNEVTLQPLSVTTLVKGIYIE